MSWLYAQSTCVCISMGCRVYYMRLSTINRLVFIIDTNFCHIFSSIRFFALHFNFEFSVRFDSIHFDVTRTVTNIYIHDLLVSMIIIFWNWFLGYHQYLLCNSFQRVRLAYIFVFSPRFPRCLSLSLSLSISQTLFAEAKTHNNQG